MVLTRFPFVFYELPLARVPGCHGAFCLGHAQGLEAVIVKPDLESSARSVCDLPWITGTVLLGETVVFLRGDSAFRCC